MTKTYCDICGKEVSVTGHSFSINVGNFVFMCDECKEKAGYEPTKNTMFRCKADSEMVVRALKFYCEHKSTKKEN